MRYLSLLVLALLPLFVFGQNRKALDAKNGFRDAVFNSPFESFTDMVEIEADKAGTTKYYKRTTDSLSIGNADLESIVYGFYNGKLYSVSIQVPGYVNSRAVLDVLKQQYGPAFQSNRYIEEYDWMGSKVWLNYKINSATKNGSVLMFSVPIMKQREADKKEAAKKAASDL